MSPVERFEAEYLRRLAKQLESDLLELHAREADLQEENAELADARRELGDKAAALARQVQDLELEVKSASGAEQLHRDLEAKYADLHASHTDLEAKLAVIADERQVLGDQAASLKKRIRELERELESARGKCSNAEQLFQEALAATPEPPPTDPRLGEALRELDELHARHRDLKTKHDRLQARHTRSRSRFDELAAIIKKLERTPPTERQDHQGKVERMRARLEEAGRVAAEKKVDHTWRLFSLPTKDEVPGFDLVNNWGATPEKLRPLFALMEVVSTIRGSARIFALISRGAGFQPNAHDNSEWEVAATRQIYKAGRDHYHPLSYGDAAAEYGSGGLFRALAPVFLWTAVHEMKGDAPLLTAPPEVMHVPRVAAFGAVVYLQRLLTKFRVDDHGDIKAGWISPHLLESDHRGAPTYNRLRNRFFAEAAKMGLNLDDTRSIPRHLRAESWPGAAAVYKSLTGTRGVRSTRATFSQLELAAELRGYLEDGD